MGRATQRKSYGNVRKLVKMGSICWASRKVGQRVIIKFQSYPFEQFGVVAGELQTIASVPSSDSTFLAFVVLPKGLQTSTHKMLSFKNGLNATAEIVTDDVSVAERMLYEVRKLWK